MRAAAAIAAIGLLGGGVVAGGALADGLPTLPLPTTTSVPVPTVTTPVPVPTTVPTVTTPISPPPPPPLPKPPPPPAPTPTVPAPAPPPVTTVTKTVTTAVSSVTKTVTSALSTPSSSGRASSGSSSGPGPVASAVSLVSGATGLRGTTAGASSPLGGPTSAGGVGGGTGALAVAGSASPAGVALSTAPTRAGSTTITRLHTSRRYVVTTGHRARSIVVTFRLRHRGRVMFTLVELSPTCRVVASFSVLGHRGTNRIRLRAGKGGHELPPGTYRLAARTPGSGAVTYTTLLVGSHRPTRPQLASALRANTCAATAELASARSVGPIFRSVFGSPLASPTPASDALASTGGGPDQSGTLGVATRAQPNIGAFSPANLSKNITDPLAVAALGAAILLLGLAALPQAAIPDPRLTDLVVRHRAEVVIAGAAAFAAGVLALAFH